MISKKLKSLRITIDWEQEEVEISDIELGWRYSVSIFGIDKALADLKGATTWLKKEIARRKKTMRSERR